MIDDAMVDAEAWYMGQRAGAKGGKLVHLWLRVDTGTEHAFDKVAGTVIGGRYAIRVTADGKSWERHVTFKGGARHDDTTRWAATDRAARDAAALERLERRLAKDTPIDDMTLAEASAWLNAAHGPNRRVRLAAILTALRA